MDQLRTLIHGNATDATVIDSQADSLLAELAAATETVDGDPHPGATPQTVDEESRVNTHTIPHEQSLDDAIFDDTTNTSSTQEDPPSSL
jgi:hypothetical protein